MLAATPARVAVGRVGPALPHEHDAALPRRSRRRQGRGAVGGRSGAARAAGDVRGRVARARQGDLPAAARPRTRAVRRGARRARASASAARRRWSSSTATGCRPRRSTSTWPSSTRALERALAARGIGARAAVLRAPLARQDHGRDRPPGRRAGGAVRVRRAPRARLRRLDVGLLHLSAGRRRHRRRPRGDLQHQPARPPARRRGRRRRDGDRAHPAREEIGRRPGALR